jgi:uncharacterized LabA/DUF88 family protein
MPTAILVDGGYFVKRYRAIVPASQAHDPVLAAKKLFSWALLHLNDRDRERRQLYRIFFYDCPPIQKKAHHPLTGRAVDFSRMPEAQFRLTLHDELKRLRKVALRMGRLSGQGAWTVRTHAMKDLLAGRITVAELNPDDLVYEIRQKGVDMRIGLDIASLAFKRQVDQIVLIAGDSDFVPAAKLARREGIDFILDSMWATVPDDLHEHIDGLRSTCPRPEPKADSATAQS